MRAKRIAVVTYHKYPGEDWPAEEFSEQTVELGGGAVVPMKLAERGTRLSNGLWVRQVRKLSAGGKQTAILSTDYEADYTRLAASMFARWSQENFFKYMREHYGLDRLVEYGTEAVPDSVRVVNPAWRQLDSQVRTLTGKRQRLLVQFAAQGLQGELSESEVTRYQQKKAQLQEEIEHLGKQLDQIKLQRKQTAHHVTVGELPEAERFSRLLSERKHFLDTFTQTLLHLLPSGHSFSRGLLGALGNIVASGLSLLPAVAHIQMRTMLGSMSLTMAARSPAGAVSFRERSEDGDRGQTFNLAQHLASLGSSINGPDHGSSAVLDREP
jgi:hypothetical protein